LQWGGGGGTNVTIDGAINMNGAGAAIQISPTSAGTVTINPNGASTMNNVAIGGTTPLAGTFTDFRVNNTISLNGSTGTANYLLQSNGASAPSWVNPASLTVSAASTATTATNANNVAIVDDTTTAISVYPVWSNGTTGNQALETSSTKLSFVPSTGVLTSNSLSVSSTSTFNGTATFNGSSSTTAMKILNAAEPVNVVAAAPSSTQTYYVNLGSVQYYTTNAANNWTLNVAFSSGTSLNTAMAVGDVITVTLLATQGATAYYQSDMQIDGNSITPKWQGGSAPTLGNASGIDAYVFAIVKTASATFTVFASQTQFK
jgi:hypothetical protein